MWEAVLGALPAVGGFLGDLFGGESAGEREWRAYLGRLGALPTANSQEWMGLAQTSGMNPLEGYRDSPEVRRAMYDALSGLGQEATSTGLGAQEQAGLSQAYDQAAAQNRMARGALQQGAAARMGGGIDPYTMSMMGGMNQGTAQSNYMAGTQAAGQAAQRRLGARQAYGQLGGQVGEYEWGKARDTAEARRLIDQFNAAARLAATQGAYGYNLQRTMAGRPEAGGLSAGEALNRMGGRELGAGMGGVANMLGRAAFGPFGKQQQPNSAYGTEDWKRQGYPRARLQEPWGYND